MKNILFVIESLSGGGAEKVLATIIQNFDLTKYNICVLSIVDTGIYRDEIKNRVNYKYIIPNENCGKLKKFFRKILYHFVYFWAPLSLVAKIFIPKGYDTTIAFVEGFATKLVSTVKNTNTKLIAWVHCDLKEHPWPIENRIFSSVEEERFAYSKFNTIVCVSEAARNNFLSLYKLTDSVIHINNPIDKIKILESSAEPCEIENSKTFQFISIGRLVHAKGYDRLIDACKQLIAEGYNFKLKILGDGIDKYILESKIKEYKLNKQIALIGFHRNPYKFLKASDCFVCSSRTEGYSLVIAEAMCLGLPIIATKCAGPSEILNNGQYGLLVENSTNGIYLGMKEVLDKTDLVYLKKQSLTRSLDFDIKSSMTKIYHFI